MKNDEKNRDPFMMEINEEDNVLFSKEELEDATYDAYESAGFVASYSSNFGNGEWVMNEVIFNAGEQDEKNIEAYRKWFFRRYGIILCQGNCNLLEYDFEEYHKETPSFNLHEIKEEQVVEDLSLIEAYELHKEKLKSLRERKIKLSKYDAISLASCFCKLSFKVFSHFTNQLFTCVDEKINEDDIKGFISTLYGHKEFWSNADLNRDFHLNTGKLIEV